MKAIDRKLVRDLGQLRGQVITIVLVVASGIATYVGMNTTYRSLHGSKNSYYESYRFPDVFALARRAPDSVVDHIRDIPGVALAYARTVERVRIPLAEERAAPGQILSLPSVGRPPLNDVYLKSGRLPEPDALDEALLLEIFGKAHGIGPGDRIDIVINGTIRQITITGLAMSPEFVFAFGDDIFSYEPGAFGALWMRRPAVAAAFDMDGAFNDVVVRLQPGASAAAVIAALDRVLAPYGAFGAFDRDKQVSNHYVESELKGLEVQATIVPFVFLAVAAFLVNVVLGRLIQLQRGQIATLKAVGYSNLAVGLHFLKLVSVIVLLGSALGVAAGSWIGSALTGVYEQYFSFPVFEAQLDADVILTAITISLMSAVVGGFISIRRIISMPPAEAMRPPAPPSYRRSFIDVITAPFVGALGRMIAREISRRPVRVLVSSAGISMAVAILVMGRFMVDSLDYMLELHFGRSMTEDVTVALREPAPARVAGNLVQLPGVTHAEGLRAVPIRIRAGARVRETAIQSWPSPSRYRALLNRDAVEVELPLEGVLLTDILAERLGIEPGDVIDITLLEGGRREIQVLVSGTVSDMLGMQAYMRLDALRTLLREEPLVSLLLLSVDTRHVAEVQHRLYEMPAVASVLRPAAARTNFENQQGETMLVMTFVLAFFASIIAIGIVYNNARVALSMRQRDLASMRVLGFTRREISSVLLGELSIQVLLALPVGMWLGTIAADAVLAADPENFRMPALISIRTYLFAAAITIGAALVSGLLVRRKLDRLDLIEVLKTRE